MKSKKMIIIILVVVLLSAAALIFTSPAISGEPWKKGSVTGVSDYSLKIDGLSFLVDQKVVITDYNNNEFPSELSVLRGVDKIIYKTKDGKVVEIRIIERKH